MARVDERDAAHGPPAQIRTELDIGRRGPDFVASTLDGDPARLAEYAGQRVVFLFASPFCGSCRDELPVLARLAPLAMSNAKILLVLVSDGTAGETRDWLDGVHADTAVALTVPVLVAPGQRSSFFEEYNPRGVLPYFCLVDEDGLVVARSPLFDRPWLDLKRLWEGVARLAPWMAR